MNNGPYSFVEEKTVLQDGAMRIGVTLTRPERDGRAPCVLLAGGSMSHLRDGDLLGLNHPGPPRKAMKILARRLAGRGYASLRWDKPNYGESHCGRERPHVSDHVGALEKVFLHARQHPLLDGERLVIAGESAGAYYTCLFARKGGQSFAYALLGALGSSIERLYEYNYGRTARYAERSPEHRVWVESVAPMALALGVHYRTMLAEALRGADMYRLDGPGGPWEIYLPPLKEQMEQEPLPRFDHLQRPVLVLQGEYDMNVPPGDARMIGARILSAGNPDVSVIIIPETDHSFQLAPGDEEERLKQRISLTCLSNPYSETFYSALLHWLDERVGGGKYE